MPIFGSIKRNDFRRNYDLKNVIYSFNASTNFDLPRVLIHKQVLLDMYTHANSEPHHEIGGYLIGYPANDINSNVKFTLITKAIRAKYNSTPTFIELKPESFIEVEKVRKIDNSLVVGWYHSHPNLGIFYSSIDKNNHKTNHPQEYQIGIVIDPFKTTEHDIESCSKWIGFFGWNNNKEIVELPRDNVYFVDILPSSVGPEYIPVEEFEIQIQQKINTTIAPTLLHLSKNLREYRDVFDTKLPIVIFLKEIQDNHLPSSHEGMIFGEVDRVASTWLIIINSFHPIELHKVQEYFKSLRKSRKDRKTRKENSKHPINQYPELSYDNEGFSRIGIFLTEERLQDFSSRGWLRRPKLDFKIFAKHCGEYYMILIMSKQDQDNNIPAVKVKIWDGSNNKLLEVPSSQVFNKPIMIK